MKLFRDLLETGGHNVIGAKDGMEALKLARQQHPNLIIMDMKLPDVSGRDVTKWIKEDETLKSIPIVAVSASAMKEDKEQMFEAGCDAYITKPIIVSDFLETIQGFLK